ncbi:hypothetical protein FRC09_009248, partial [Ceratobasidium sp. 395]
MTDVINAITKTCKSALSVFADWSQWESDYLKLCNGDLEHGARAAAESNHPENLRPCYEYLFRRQLAWRRAIVAAPEVHKFSVNFGIHMRAFIYLHLAAQRIEDVLTARGQNDKPRFLELTDAVVASKSLLVELRVKYFEFDALNCCALFWHSKLEADWLTDDPTGNPALLRKLIQGQLDWKQALPRVIEGIVTRRKKLKRAIGVPGEDSSTHTVKFFFGYPQESEEPAEFHGALKRLENMLSRDPSADSNVSPRQKDPAANVGTHESTAAKTTGEAALARTSPSALATPARQHPKLTLDAPAVSAPAEPVASDPPILPAPKSRKKRLHKESAPSEPTNR